MTLIERARAGAHEAHDSIKQERKYTGGPYWVHTDAVADAAAAAGLSEIEIAAAHLHDTLEDVMPLNPKYDNLWIAREFGEPVLALVVELTDVFTKENFPDLNRKERKQRERERVGQTSVEAQNIKLLDIEHNMGSIVPFDPDFSQVYLREMLDLLPHLSKARPDLLNRVAMQTVQACQKVGIYIPILAHPSAL